MQCFDGSTILPEKALNFVGVYLKFRELQCLLEIIWLFETRALGMSLFAIYLVQLPGL
jgi:hypothetical protein